MNKKGIRRIADSYHYFFVKPNSKENVHETAERLMSIASVEEVSVIEGQYGFVVKARDDGKEIINRINKTVNGTSSTAMCHCQYVR